jgi:hypothetical protein
MPSHKILLAAVCLGLSSTQAFAQSASSSAYAANANESVSTAGIVTANVNVGPIAPSGGSAPPPYNNSASVASLSDSAGLTTGLLGVTQGLQTGILTSNSNGSSTGGEATATVNNLALTLGTSQLLSSLLNLSATTIQSYSQANSVGGLDASGSTTIEGLVITGSVLAGLTIDGSLFVNPAPNTVLLSLDGLSIILNEQTALGDGITSAGISTNAIHLAFDGFPLGTSLANGDIIIGHSQALASLGQPSGVPEPSSWAMMLIGFGATGLALRRRRQGRSLLQLA